MSKPSKAQSTSISDEWGMFTIIPNELIDADDSLSINAKYLFILLRYYTNGKTQSAFPSYEVIRRKTGWAKTTISRAIKELEQAEWLIKQRQFGANTHYVLKRPPVAKMDSPSSSENGLLKYRNATTIVAEMDDCTIRNARQKIEYTKTDNTKIDSLLPSAGSGTKRPVKVSQPKKPATNPNHRHPMAEVYREVMEYPALTRLQCDQIAAQVTDEGAWREILTYRNVSGWKGHGVQRALVEYERRIQGETLDQIYNGGLNGNGKQQTYETKGERNARHTLAIAERLAERRQRRIPDAADSGDTEATGIILIRNER